MGNYYFKFLEIYFINLHSYLMFSKYFMAYSLQIYLLINCCMHRISSHFLRPLRVPCLLGQKVSKNPEGIKSALQCLTDMRADSSNTNTNTNPWARWTRTIRQSCLTIEFLLQTSIYYFLLFLFHNTL